MRAVASQDGSPRAQRQRPASLSRAGLRGDLVANQGTSGPFGNFLINQQLAILAGRVANEKDTHLVSHVRPQTASTTAC